MPDSMLFDLNEAVGVLKNTPETLRAMLAGLNDSWIHHNYGPETFSPFDVVGHLIHGERADWIPRLRIILEHGTSKPFEPFDRYAMYKQNQGRTINELLTTFAKLRQDNLAALNAMCLTPAQLALHGTHPDLGPVTVRELLSTWVVHDLNHIHQIAKSMAHQYRTNVGPWRRYIPFLPQE